MNGVDGVGWVGWVGWWLVLEGRGVLIDCLIDCVIDAEPLGLLTSAKSPDFEKSQLAMTLRIKCQQGAQKS